MANLILRMPNDLHDLARIAAAIRRKSLNAYVLEAVRMHVVHMARGRHGAPLRAMSQPQDGGAARLLKSR